MALDLDALSILCEESRKNNQIDCRQYSNYKVKRGLRYPDGTGVMAGLTRICNVHGYVLDEGERHPVDGVLTYRGMNVEDIVHNCQKDGRFSYEETVWLLLFGYLPDRKTLEEFTNLLSKARELPEYFAEDMIIKAPSPNIMNKLARSVLALYSYDDNPDDISLRNVLRQSINIIAQLPTIMGYAYQVKRRHYDHESMVLHPVLPGQSTAEFILGTLRNDRKFTREEAMLLDLCLTLHAEHGGGNNSSFTCRVLTSAGTDTYSAIAAAIGSLKGPRHGGANMKVLEMMQYIKKGVSHWGDRQEVASFLEKMIRKEAGDGSGLIYGMGHAVYTMSDPRAVLLKEAAGRQAKVAGLEREFELLQLVEELTPSVFAKVKGQEKAMCANVDLYSGLVYRSLQIPPDLFTPIFAVARIAGWCAHRIEEVLTGGKIIRPAYKSVCKPQVYLPLNKRKPLSNRLAGTETRE